MLLSVRWLCKAGGLFANCFFIRRQSYSGLWREMGKISSLIGIERDINVNPTAYLSVRNVSMHSLLIRYRRVRVPALRLWGRTKNRANVMTEVIATSIAPLRLYTVNAGTSIYWCWKDYCWPLKACLYFCHIFLEYSWQGTVIQCQHTIRSKAPRERQSPLCHTSTSCILLSDGCQALWQTGKSVCQVTVITVFLWLQNWYYSCYAPALLCSYFIDLSTWNQRCLHLFTLYLLFYSPTWQIGRVGGSKVIWLLTSAGFWNKRISFSVSQRIKCQWGIRRAGTGSLGMLN